MTEEEIERAEQIIEDFLSWDRPLSVEEDRLVDRYYDLQMGRDYIDPDGLGKGY